MPRRVRPSQGRTTQEGQRPLKRFTRKLKSPTTPAKPAEAAPQTGAKRRSRTTLAEGNGEQGRSKAGNSPSTALNPARRGIQSSGGEVPRRVRPWQGGTTQEGQRPFRCVTRRLKSPTTPAQPAEAAPQTGAKRRSRTPLAEGNGEQGRSKAGNSLQPLRVPR